MSDVEWTVDWIKSSQSGSLDCVQVAWTKSSRSTDTGACVQVKLDGGKIWLRDSKHPDGPILKFTGAEWEAFLAGVRDGEFDIP
jgi:hypothetical protein